MSQVLTIHFSRFFHKELKILSYNLSYRPTCGDIQGVEWAEKTEESFKVQYRQRLNIRNIQDLHTNCVVQPVIHHMNGLAYPVILLSYILGTVPPKNMPL